jgi:ABC-2 type transport system permease protein
MRTTWLVMKHAIATTLRKRSFWLFTFLMPAFLLAFNTYYFLRDAGVTLGDSEQAAEEAPAPEIPAIGLVDDAGIVEQLPEAVPAGMFQLIADRETALADLESGALDQVVYIPSDYVNSGDVTIYTRNFQITSDQNGGVATGSAQAWLLPYILTLNLVDEPALANAVFNPTPGNAIQFHPMTSPAPDAGSNLALARIIASVTPYVYYFVLVISAGYMMQSVTAEKENRVVEVLLTSAEPRQIMVGKILGMSVVVLLQISVWLGAAAVGLNRLTQTLDLSSYSLPPGFLIWSLLFLVLGYLLYASVMAAAGAIAPSAREAGQVTWLLILPLLPTLMFGVEFAEDPHGTLALALSLFPFSAPSAMVTRLAVADIPLWQVLLSLALLAGTAYLFVSLSARFFRADNLLSDAAFNWKRLLTGWRDPA